LTNPDEFYYLFNKNNLLPKRRGYEGGMFTYQAFSDIVVQIICLEENEHAS